MIVHKTFTKIHRIGVWKATLEKRERLREEAEQFIAETIAEEDLVSIAETGDEIVSTVTVWYRKR